MATVPTSPFPTVENRPAPFVPQNADFTPQAFGAGIGQGEQAVGGALAKDGSELGAVADHMAYQGALRTAKGADMNAEKATTDLGYTNLPGFNGGNNKGYFSLQGQDAVDAKPIYDKAVADLHSQINDGLADNPRAQTLFNVQSAQRQSNAYNMTSRYAMQQGTVADNNASNARIGAYSDSYTSNYNDPAALANFQKVTAGEISQQAQANGWGPDVQKQQLQAVQSKGYKDAILMATSQGQVQQAAQMFQTLAPQMDANTRVALAQHLEPLVTGNLADTWVKQQMGTAAPAGGTTGTFADNIRVESGGKQFDATGAPLVSKPNDPDSPVGSAQIKPSTALETAASHGIPATIDGIKNNQALNEQLGGLYHSDLMQKYGGNKMLADAAYNAGPGNLDKWLQTIGDPTKGEISNADFVKSIPFPETRNYVMKTGSGQSAPAGDASDANLAVHPDFASMALKAQTDFADNPKLLAATTSRIHAASASYELQNQGDRDAIEKSWRDNIAAATSGQDTVNFDEAKIRHVFRPAVADYMMGQAQDAVTSGQLNSAIKMASPTQETAILQDLTDGLGPKATLDHLRGKQVVPNAGDDPTQPMTEDADHFVQRMKALNAAQAAIASKRKMLADDPATYAMQDPTVAAAYKAVPSSPQDPNYATATQAAIAASQSSQKALGVDPADVRTLTNSQASALVKQLHQTTPEKGDMGQALNQLEQTYGPAYGGVMADLQKAGLNPRYTLLGHANLPEQATLRSDAQRAFQEYDALKDKAEYGAAIPADQKKLLEPALDDALANYRSTIGASANADTVMASTIYPGVKMLAQHYMINGMSASDAATRAAGLVNKSYNFDGPLRVPNAPGMPSVNDVRSSQQTLLNSLTDADLKGTTAAEARRGTLFTNGDDKGATVLKGTLQGGYMPVMRADGKPLSLDFKNLPKPTYSAAAAAPSPAYNAGLN